MWCPSFCSTQLHHYYDRSQLLLPLSLVFSPYLWEEKPSPSLIIFLLEQGLGIISFHVYLVLSGLEWAWLLASALESTTRDLGEIEHYAISLIHYSQHHSPPSVQSMHGTMKRMLAGTYSSRFNTYVCRSCLRQPRWQKRNYATPSDGSSPDIYDVVCIGGGPAGLSLLAALGICPYEAVIIFTESICSIVTGNS